MKQTILRNMVILTLIAVIASSGFSVLVVYNHHLDYTSRELRDDADFIMNLMDERYTFSEFVQSSTINNGSTRITIVDPSGLVIFDNQANPAEMDNHADREEIETAFDLGEAETRRVSNTLGTNTLYYAILLEDGNVIRFAKETDSFLYTMYRMLTIISMLIVGVIIVAIYIGDKMTDTIITPINNLNLDKPLENDVYEELSPLLTRINRQNRDIRNQMRALEKHKEEFEMITNNMTEGLIILDARTRIVYMNLSAYETLGDTRSEPGEFIGKNLLRFNRDLDLRSVVDQGLKGEHSETILLLNNMRYQLLVSPISSEGEKTRGVIIILVNITEKYQAEQMRKEFTANVSHELKTPLTAISTYAEMLKNNMVKPEDIHDFAGRIYDESGRMISLIEDILKLSRLDEKVEIRPKENVDLYQLSTEVIKRLEPLAEAKNIELAVAGESVKVLGDPGILFEMIYNICDNGIKYSKGNSGKVTITSTKVDHKVILEIADDGRGIPLEHQERIFERFYRVDKSHSRKTGGTGLGLSIVKHGAAYHNATLKLDSAENVGTKITIEFPLPA